MNIKRIFVLLMALCMVFGLCACGNESKDEPVEAPQQPDVQAPVQKPEVPEEPVEEETQPAGITYTVKVQDEGGNPVVGAMIQICQIY